MMEAHIRKLRDARAGLLERLKDVDSSLLKNKPAAEKWCVMEILEHLILAEEYAFRTLAERSALRNPKLSSRSRFRIFLVYVVLKFGIPVKAPSRSMLPQGILSLDEFRSKWDANFARMMEFWAKLSSEDWNKPMFFHPFAGPLTVADAMRLNQIHIESHARQIEKILGS